MKKKIKKQTHEEKKTQYTRLGLGMSGICVNNATAELIWRVFKRMDEKKGQFSLSDGVELEFFIANKYKIERTKKKWVAEPAKDNGA